MTTSEDDSLGNFLSVKPKALSFVHRIAIDTETSKQMAEQANGMCSCIRNLWRKAHTPTTDRSSENKSTLATATATARSSTSTDSPFNSNQPVTMSEKNNQGMTTACSSSSRSSKSTLRRGVTMPALPEHNAVGSEVDNFRITGAPYSRAGHNLTSSQIEFFRLLDEKIAQGPDYDPLADS
ncbi:Uncharacterized protein TSPI_10228 [Trichinella spiralis]|uniref:Uncharacterized protein n=1 Tax=Trichinella spiralis TaxID=6334 RepID=A0ABR3KQ59_TRISP